MVIIFEWEDLTLMRLLITHAIGLGRFTLPQFFNFLLFIIWSEAFCNWKQRKWQKDLFVVRRKILLNGQVLIHSQLYAAYDMHNEANSGYDMDLSLLGRQWNGFWTQEITSRWDGNGQNRSFWQNWWVLALKNSNIILFFSTIYAS